MANQFRGIFGNTMGQPGFAQMDGNAPNQAQRLPFPTAPGGMEQPQQHAAPQQPKTWQTVLGILGDTLAGASGGQPIYTQNMMAERQRQQQMQYLDQQRQQERKDKMADAISLLDYKAAHPEAQNPTALQQNYEYLLRTDPTAAANYKARMTANVTWARGPDGNMYPMQMPTQEAPPSFTNDDWDNAPPAGGPTASQSGGFRP